MIRMIGVYIDRRIKLSDCQLYQSTKLKSECYKFSNSLGKK
jgi:hypothetical protein